MFDNTENAVYYKWDPRAHTGFKLRYDREAAAKGGNCCFHVEDWSNWTVTNEWPCEDLDEALEVLDHLFRLDVAQERARLSHWTPEVYRAAA